MLCLLVVLGQEPWGCSVRLSENQNVWLCWEFFLWFFPFESFWNHQRGMLRSRAMSGEIAIERERERERKKKRKTHQNNPDCSNQTCWLKWMTQTQKGCVLNRCLAWSSLKGKPKTGSVQLLDPPLRGVEGGCHGVPQKTNYLKRWSLAPYPERKFNQYRLRKQGSGPDYPFQNAGPDCPFQNAGKICFRNRRTMTLICRRSSPRLNSGSKLSHFGSPSLSICMKISIYLWLRAQ